MAKELNDSQRPDLFSATPPLELLRSLITVGAIAQWDTESWGAWERAERKYTAKGSKQGKEDDDNRIAFLYSDISRAYIHAPAKEDKYVQLPGEDWKIGDEQMCGKLRVSMYGTRDAAKNWEAHYSDWLCSIGFSKGLASPCSFYNKSKKIRIVVHGDDFLTAGPVPHLRWLKEKMD